MKWIDKRKIFDPRDHVLPNNCIEFAQSPQALVFQDFVRIYFSTRAKDHTNGKFISHIAFVDFDKDFRNILAISDQPVINLGDLGCFDEHGIFPISPLRIEDKIYAYTCGWSRRLSVSVETSTGLAISNNGGRSFTKIGSGPVLTSSLHEPFLVGDSFVRKYGELFHMWYIFGKAWLEPKLDEPVARIYKIGHAISSDGIKWEKEEGKAIIPDVLGLNECQALPSVIKIGRRYHMYFCYRQATDFRKNSNRAYRLGYAYSDDLVLWTRNDDLAGIEPSSTGWDSEMMCYPHIFQSENNIWLLHNGNEFGRFGFGIARLDQNSL